MRKKYLSALLFGALLFASTGTFTSCKDYDDDISNLQSQHDSLQSDMQSKLDAVNSTLTSLTEAQSGLQESISSLNSQIATIQDEAEKHKAECQAAILEAQNTAIETARTELEATKTELEKTIQDAVANLVDQETLNAQLDSINNALSTATGRISALETAQAGIETEIANLKLADETLQESLNKVSEAYAAADQQLSNRIDALDATLQQQGTRLAAIELQMEALETYKTQTDANTTAIETVQKELADLQARVEVLEAGVSDADFKKIEEMIKKDIDESLVVIDAVYTTMVTHVSLVASATASQEEVKDYDLSFSTITEQDNVFGKGLTGEITFKKGTQVQIGDDFIIRVSPTTAVIDASMISLQNSKGENLNDLIEITNVERYDELLTRASNANGLWKVSCKLKSYDEEAFNAIATDENKQVLFAVAINNTKGEEASDNANARQVLSSYDLTMKWGASDNLNKLSYKVNDTDVDKIRNRFDAAEDGTKAKVTEYEWSGDAATAINNSKSNVKVSDDRCANAVGIDFNNLTMNPKLLPVEQGKAFTVKLTGETSSVRAIYVVRDDANAVESAPSELNAWKSYTYEGLDQVVEGTETTITINAATAINDVIGFRVYAVNYDGTLVDPDGKAFYVVVGKTASESTADLTISPKEYAWTIANAPNSDSAAKYFSSDEKPFSTANLANVATFEVKQFASDGETSAPFDGELYLTGSNMRGVRLQDALWGGVKDLSKYTNIQYRNVDVRDLKDGETYITTVTFKDKNGGIIETATITLTKTMPTFPTSIAPFTNVLVNNVLVVYPKVKADDDKKVIYDLDNVWHGVDQYTTFAQTGVEAGKETVTYVPRALEPENNVIDNVPALVAPIAILNPDQNANAAYKTEYPMANSYTFGFISYDKLEGATAYTNNEWIVDGQSFKVRFGNYVDDCAYAWKDAAPVLVYPGVKGERSYIELDKITITDWYNRAASLATDASGLSLNGYGQKVQIDLLTGDNFSRVNEYYTATVKEDYPVGKDSKGNDIKKDVILLTSNVTASQGSSVPTKIRLTITDIYGFKTVKTFDPFTMEFQK